MVMALTLVLSAMTAFLLTSSAWWFFSVVSAVTVLYLGYLRKQTRIEERVHRRRSQRMARSHLGVENTYDREYDVVPSRLRRPGAVVLEIDDEDPVFEHLDYAPHARESTGTWRGRSASSVSATPAATGSLIYRSGAIAQLVARLVRIEKVRGSIPLSSTEFEQFRVCSAR